MQIINKVSPVQASTNSSTLVTGSKLDAGNAWTLSYTVKNTGANSMNYLVIAGNLSDLSDGVTVQNTATLAAGAIGSYSISIPLYMFYGIKIVSTVADTPGQATVNGIAKG